MANDCDSWHADSLNKFGYAAPLHAVPTTTNKYHRTHQASSGSNASGSSTSRRHRSAQALNNSTVTGSQTAATTAAFDNIQKYPCRMPLIVLCIETVAQSME